MNSVTTLGMSIPAGLQAGAFGLATMGYGLGEEAEVVPDDDNTWNAGGRDRIWHSDDKGRTWKV